MERRHAKRTLISLLAELNSVDRSYMGFIENLSEKGVALYVSIAPVEDTEDFIPGSTVKLNFKPPSKEELSLACKIKWLYKTPPHGLTCTIGMEIMDPPPSYKEFFKFCSNTWIYLERKELNFYYYVFWTKTYIIQAEKLLNEKS